MTISDAILLWIMSWLMLACYLALTEKNNDR